MTPNYETNAPRGWMNDARRGAAMGRPSITPEPGAADPAPKVTLQRVRLNASGYDASGAYWGHGAPLYWAATDDGALDVTFRAADRAAAKAHVRGIVPGARFSR